MSSTGHGGSRASAAGFESALDDMTAKGAAALRDTKDGFDEVVADMSQKGKEALASAREARDSVADVVLESVRTRPYTTLAIAGLLGFLYGAMRRR